MDAEQAEHWRIVADCDPLWLGWDDGEVVYHGRSGDTHFLDGAAARIVRRLRQSSASVADLAQMFAAGDRGTNTDNGADDGADDLLRDTAALLLELEQLSLIERRP